MFCSVFERIWGCFIFIFAFLCVFCIVENNSYCSSGGKVSLKSDRYVFENGEEFEVVVNLENSSVAAFSFSLYYDVSKVEFISGPDNINVINNRIVYVWYDATGGNNAIDGEIARFKFKAKDYGIANFVVDGEFYNLQEDLIDMEFEQLQVNIGDGQIIDMQSEELGSDTGSENASLKVLRLGKEGMVPDFQVGVYEYYLTVFSDVNNIDVVAVSDNPNAIVEITGNTDLKDGLNVILVNVFSVDKTQSNVYRINVTKTNDLELANTNLEILAIENVLLYPQFDANVTNYKAEVSNDISNINILAIPENESAIVQVSGNDDLKVGNNLVNICVMAPNGFSKRNYSVNVYKRNLEEEKKYIEDININKENLEQIYEMERVNSESESKDNGNKANENIILIIGVCFIILGIVLIIVIFVRNNKLEK